MLALLVAAAAASASPPPVPPEIGHVRVTAFCTAVRKLAPAIRLAGNNDYLTVSFQHAINTLHITASGYTTESQTDSEESMTLMLMRLGRSATDMKRNIEAIAAILDGFSAETKALGDDPAAHAGSESAAGAFRKVLDDQRAEYDQITGFIETYRMIDFMRDGSTASKIGAATGGGSRAALRTLPKGNLSELASLRDTVTIDLQKIQHQNAGDETVLTGRLVLLAAPCNAPAPPH